MNQITPVSSMSRNLQERELKKFPRLLRGGGGDGEDPFRKKAYFSINCNEIEKNENFFEITSVELEIFWF